MKVPWRTALSQSVAALGMFGAWWWQELREAAEAVLARVAPRRVTRTLVWLGSSDGNISIIRGSHRECLTTFSEDVVAESSQWLPDESVVAAVRGTRAIFAVAAQHVLTQTLTLPVAVERDLEQVIGLQLERECPMPMDRVYVDHRARRRTRAERSIEVDVLIIQRARVERLRGLAQRLGLRPVRIGMGLASGEIVGNFLSTPQRTAQLHLTRTDRRLAVGAVILAAVLLAVIAMQWGYERLKIGRALNLLQSPAATSDHLTQQLRTAAVPAEALVALMRQPDALDALTTLTEDIPQDSWLYELDASVQWPQAPRVKLSGFTPVATVLVGALQNAHHFDQVRLVSAMSAGLGSGEDRLQLTARQMAHINGPAGEPR